MQDPQVTVASSFLIILRQKSSSPLQVPISNPLLSCMKQILPSQYGPQLQPAPDSQLSKQHKLSNITIAFLWVISFMEWQLFLASLCRQLGRYYK